MALNRTYKKNALCQSFQLFSQHQPHLTKALLLSHIARPITFSPQLFFTMPKTGSIDHISLCCSAYEQSAKFYEFLLVNLLGYRQTYKGPLCTMWKGADGVCIGVSPGNNTKHHKTNPGLHHLAFNAETRELIDEIYAKIVNFQNENGSEKFMGEILDKPALYPEYAPEYYA